VLVSPAEMMAWRPALLMHQAEISEIRGASTRPRSTASAA
jgi:hypothetical protein